jgi:prepilin-type N-terminal cleavage/methylation domain-containing protein
MRDLKQITTKKGISLIEVLIVIAIFAVLGVLTTRIIVLSLRGSNKSDSLVKVRENLDYALSVMERNIRNADSITSCTPDKRQITYRDENGLVGSYSCDLTSGSVASGSGALAQKLTSDTVRVTTCTFVCNLTASPPSVTVSLSGTDTTTGGIENSKVDISTQIFLRTY